MKAFGKGSDVISETDRVYDELLLTLVRSGERQAGDRLAARWRPRLLRTARRLLQDDEAAQEAVQEAWVGICRGWLRLHDPAKFPAWAFGILHRKCVDQVRRNQRSRRHFEPYTDLNDPAGDAMSEDHIALNQAFNKLKPDHRVVAILYFQEGLTHPEIAEALSIPAGTAKSRLFHARQHLKAALSGD